MRDRMTPDQERALRVEVPPNLSNIRFALMETLEPGNIGSAARAMKGMGISDLRLINPPPGWNESAEARKFAMNSKDVLYSAQTAESLEEAIGDAHFVVGTTHRRRSRRMAEPASAREAAVEIARASQSHQAAVLFGREDFGLCNEDLARCDLIASIPMATKSPSLNLAQAAQIFAYEIFMASVGKIEPFQREPAPHRDVQAAVRCIEEMLRAVEFRPMNGDWGAVTLALKRVMARASLETRDLEVAMKICRSVEYFANETKTGTA